MRQPITSLNAYFWPFQFNPHGAIGTIKIVFCHFDKPIHIIHDFSTIEADKSHLASGICGYHLRRTSIGENFYFKVNHKLALRFEGQEIFHPIFWNFGNTKAHL